MEQKTLQIRRSTKTVKKLEDIVGNRKYILPRAMANECDPVTMKAAVMVIINSKKIFIPVEELIEIPQNAFSVLKDVGILKESYQEDKPFDPLYVY